MMEVQSYRAKEANHQHLRQQEEISVSSHGTPLESATKM
jgi:hypothetical protein